MNEWFTLRNSRRRPIFQSFLLKRNQRQGSNQPHFFILFISTPMKRIEKKCWVVLLLLHSPSTAPTNQSQIHSTPWICLICGLLIGSFRPAASGPFAPFIHKSNKFSLFIHLAQLRSQRAGVDFIAFIQLPFRGFRGASLAPFSNWIHLISSIWMGSAHPLPSA